MDIDYRNTLSPSGGWGYHPYSMPADRMHLINQNNSNGREARNRAEKNRRDKLNALIQQLLGMVPHVADSQRRVDKTAVLRYSAHGLRIHYIFGGKTSNPPSAEEQTCFDAFLNMMNLFLITVTCRGQIAQVSPNVEQHLGHCQTDLLGQNIMNYVHPDDQRTLATKIVPTNIDTLFDTPLTEGEESRPRTKEEEERIDEALRQDKRNFTIRIARAGPRSEPTAYEMVRITGHFRRADMAPRETKSSSLPSGLTHNRRSSRGRDDGIPLHKISGNDISLICMAKIIKPPTLCDRLLEACKYEYQTRHLIDGRIVQCDQRISIVAGYMTEEVSGLSPFTFMHKDDVRWVIVALRQMYDLNKPHGESCYRLITRTGQFIYLRTRGYLEVDDTSNEVRSFVCVNTLVTEEEGKLLVKEMKKKFSVIINSGEDVPAIENEVQEVENPLQIERAVMNLITNLHGHEEEASTTASASRSTPSMERPISDDASMADDNDDADDANSSTTEHLHDESYHSDIDRLAKSPPLAIIAPKASTIKSSISKSVDVIIAATKNTNSKSPVYTGSLGDNNNISNASNKNIICNAKRPSVLQKNTTTTTTITSSARTFTLVEETINCTSSNNMLIDRPKSSSEHLVSLDSVKTDCDHYESTPNTDAVAVGMKMIYNSPSQHTTTTSTTSSMILPHQIKQEDFSRNQVSSPPQFSPNYNSPSSLYFEAQHKRQQLSPPQGCSSGQIIQHPHHQQQMQLQQQQQHHHHLHPRQQLPQQSQQVYNSVITTQQTMQQHSTSKNGGNYYHHSQQQQQQQHQRRHMPSTLSPPSLKRGNYMDDYGNEKEQLTKRRMVNTMTQNTSIYSVCGDELKDINRELTQVLPSSFEAIDRSLTHQHRLTSELQNQYSAYPEFSTTHHHQQLHEMIEEHQEHDVELQLLRNEFQYQQAHHQQQHQHQQQQHLSSQNAVNVPTMATISRNPLLHTLSSYQTSYDPAPLIINPMSADSDLASPTTTIPSPR